MAAATRVLGGVAAVLSLVGAVVVLTAPPVSFAWWTSAPLADDVFADRVLPVVLGGRQLVGLALVLAGLVVAGLAIGIKIGRRQPR